MPVEQVYLIRHGETDWNAEKRWQGSIPTELNSLGYQQARLLAQHLSPISFSAIYASDLPRAHQTAQALAELSQQTVQIEADLQEVNVGILQGFTGDELRTRYPKIFAEWINGSMDFAPPDGESRRDGQIRMARIFDAIVARHDGIVAMVSHGGTIRLLLRMLFSDHQAIQNDQYTLPNTSYSRLVRTTDGAWTVHELGVTPHLSASQGREDQQRVL